MKELLGKVIAPEEQNELKELISILIILPKEDRALLLSNAMAFKTRMEIEKINKNRAG